MALRNSSSNLLVEITAAISPLQDTKCEIFHQLMSETMLPEIQKGLKCASEVKILMCTFFKINIYHKFYFKKKCQNQMFAF